MQLGLFTALHLDRSLEESLEAAVALGLDAVELPVGSAHWPTEYRELLDWQWTERVVPYWREQAAAASARGLRLAFEMHPGFVVYNPSTLLRLREACGEAIGANLDPSHLFWQGIDVLAAIDVLDTRPLGDVGSRAWVFRTVGWGHDALFWREFATALRRVGYDDVLSIEHEDAYLSIDEGLRQAVTLLQSILPREPAPKPWWA